MVAMQLETMQLIPTRSFDPNIIQARLGLGVHAGRLQATRPATQ